MRVTVLILNNANHPKDVDYVLQQVSAINVFQISQENQIALTQSYFLKISLFSG